MTPHGKAHHVVHCLLTPLTGAAVRRWSPVEGRSCDNFVAHSNRNYDSLGPGDCVCGFVADLDLRQRCWLGFRPRRTSRPRSARQRTVQSTVSRGGVSCRANHWRVGAGRPLPTREHPFPTVHHKIATPLPLQRGRFGRAIHIGYFKTVEAAIGAHADAADRLYGEFSLDRSRPSGRADESAMCPAVARSFEGRAA